MAENKVAKIPVASHGLHKHSYNYPWLSSINFGDVMPCYINTVRKGEKDSPKGGLFSQLMPIAHNAFATGRFNFKAIFVPYKLVWRPWYAFDQQLEYNAGGKNLRIERYPYVEMGAISTALCTEFSSNETATDEDYDICLLVDTGQSTLTPTYYKFTTEGRRVLRILGALGCMPTWISNDKRPLNILPIMCYLKAFADYYFPNNYVGNQAYRMLAKFFERDDVDFGSEVTDLVVALEYASLNFYESCVFDLAWDNPVSPNVAHSEPSVVLPDVTDTESDLPSLATNQVVTNGTPSLIFTKDGFTKFALDSLKSLSLWAKRRQLSGARLLDKFLVSRGVTLQNDSARISYFLGQRNVEIQVSGVENNTDTNLGELAGRGVASTGNEPLSFECNADDDGLFLIVVSALPDANFPILTDGFSVRRNFMQNYNPEFDKIGACPVPSFIIQNTMDGNANYQLDPNGESVFGFLNQYWDEIQERPRLLGDFILQSRGAEELQAYHTFRMLSRSAARAHSFGFLRMYDNEQYQRLFYSSKQENLMLFLRWYGEQYKEKLPLGDSYDWDDDEMNKRVSVVVGGSQK